MPSGSHDAAFKTELKKLIVSACNREVAAESIGDDEALVGRGGRLELDSLDILQINVAIAQKTFLRRAKLNGLARDGSYEAAMEQAAA